MVVQNATLHNADEIERLGVRIGDWVQVERGGDVIPKVVQIAEPQNSEDKRPRKKFKMPVKCPSCGSEIVRTPGEADHRCVNVACPAKLREMLIYFASRGVMNTASPTSLASPDSISDASSIRTSTGAECSRNFFQVRKT